MNKKQKYQHNHELKDAWIHGMIESAFILNERINAYHIDIEVKNASVTLTGRVINDIDKWLCEELIKGFSEIKQIKNELIITDIDLFPQDTAGSQQTYYQWFNDSNTTAKVKSKLSWNKDLSGHEIEVSTESGVVTLNGTVDYQANKALAELIVRNMDFVKSVKNNLSTG